MIIKNIKINKKGFVVLFAIVITSILLAISLGVSNVALKEQKFSTSAKDTNEAFFAADTGAECALYYDQINIFDVTNLSDNEIPINCGGEVSVSPNEASPDFMSWEFVIPKLGYSSESCAKVYVEKGISNGLVTYTKIFSKGYNVAKQPDCMQLPNSLERALELNY